MTFKIKTFQKIISCLLIVAVIVPTVFFSIQAKKANAQFAAVITDIVDSVPTVIKFVEDHIGDIIKQFLETVARKLIDRMTQDTVNWINGGFHGAPLFIQNPTTFFKGIIHDQLQGFINETAFDPYHFPFGQNYALSIRDMATQGFAQNTQYSLSQMNLDDAEYARQQNDFAAGGWGGLLMNTQALQNNFIGYGILADNEVREQISGLYSNPQQAKDKVAQGSGFLSQEDCKSNPNWDAKKALQGPPPNADGSLPSALDDQVWQATYGCPEGPTTETPGRVAADSIMNALGSKQRQGELGAALGNSLSAIFDALIGKLFNLGLNALASNVASPDPNTTNLNDFNIYGNTSANAPTQLGATNNPTLTPTNPHMTLTISAVNDNGGTLYDPDTLKPFVNNIGSRFNSAEVFVPGDYVVTIDPVPGYTIAYGQDCHNMPDGGHITMVENGQYSCHIYLDDISTTAEPAYVVAHVNVTNDNNGTVTPSDIAVSMNGNYAAQDFPYIFASYADDVIVSLSRPTGYTVTYGGDCTSQGTVQLIHAQIGRTYTCVITLDDVAGWFQAKMAVNTVVVNDNPNTPGTLKASDIQISVDGKTQTTIAPVTTIVSGATNEYTAGNASDDLPPPPIAHVISGTPEANYTVTYSGDCDTTGTIKLAHSPTDATLTCTMTYDDK